MYALVSPKEIQLSAGGVVKLLATWQDYQALLQQRGDGSCRVLSIAMERSCSCRPPCA